MPRKKKCALPSGKVRVQRKYKGPDGKYHTKSFTASTAVEANALADEWSNHRREIDGKMTVRMAVQMYIDSKENVLSPSTIRPYRAMLRNHFDPPFGDILLVKITNHDIQLWVSDLSSRLKPKTVRNNALLFISALKMFAPKFDLMVTLPSKQRQEYYCPSDADIRTLLSVVTNDQLKAAIYLAAVGTLRRGEICGLMRSDIDGNVIHVHNCMVLNDDKEYVMKPYPKTYESYRYVPMPGNIIEFLLSLPENEDGRLLSVIPSYISDAFAWAVKKSGLPHFRFHDLRHFSASYLHAHGVPDLYIEKRGGWAEGSYVMKRIYQNVIDLEKVKQDKKILDAFGTISGTLDAQIDARTTKTPAV